MRNRKANWERESAQTCFTKKSPFSFPAGKLWPVGKDFLQGGGGGYSMEIVFCYTKLVFLLNEKCELLGFSIRK